MRNLGLRSARSGPAGRLTTPVQGFTRTSEWGQRGARWHHGIDLMAPIGTPLYAMADGTVISSTPNGATGYSDYGETIRIDHGDVECLYAHMNRRFVQAGDVVRQGQQIGEVGDTCGDASNPSAHMQITASHVHYEVMIGPYPTSRGAPDGTGGSIRSMNPRDYFAQNGQTLGQDPVSVDKTPGGGGVKKNLSWKFWLGLGVWGLAATGIVYVLWKKG